jgi:superfamily II DNA/RNA helicase
MPQSKRTETLERFRNGEIRLLVASDVAARGLDIQGMSHVFNFDVPIHAEDYVHRIGRTGRAGREGRAFTLAAPEDGRFVQAIEQLIGKPIPPVSVEGIAAATLSFEEGDDRGRSRSRRGRSKGRAHEPHRDAHRGSSRKGEQRQEAPHAAKPHQSTPKSEPAHKPTPARYAPITMGAAPAPEPAAPVASRDRHNYDDGPRVVGFGDHMPAFLARRAARG